MKKLFAVLLILFLFPTVNALSANVNITADTTVVNSNFLDVNIWYLCFLLGPGFMILSHLTKKETGAPIWALIAPFFTFITMWFSMNLAYIHINSAYDCDTGVYKILLEHFVYHLDWIATGILTVIFLISIVSMLYVWTKKPIEKMRREDLF